MCEQYFMDALLIPNGPWPHDLKAQVIYVGWWVIMIVMIGYWSLTDPKRPKSSWISSLKSRIKSKNK